MKKLSAIILCLAMLFLCACGNSQNETETTTESTTQAEETTVRVKSESLYDDYKYRSTYYSVPASFVELVGKDVFWDWFRETPYRVYPLDVDEMAMVAFIKKFNISREDFDRANEKREQTLLKTRGFTVMNPAKDDPYYDRNVENCELYDGDLIYTFDNELINAYYLYVDPYEDESSTDEHIHDIEDCNCGADFTLDDLPMRYIYYSLSESYANLVEDQDEFDEWYKAREISDDMDEMLYVSFVKRFNISREDFDKATEERIRIITEVRGRTPVTPPFDTAHEAELCEVPNADVIYTFDNEFIKEYYKRENANVTLEIPTTVE